MRRTSLTVESYYPEQVKRILTRCGAEPFQQYVLVGFSETMKWLSRIFRDRGVPYLLGDWRAEFAGYDCSNDVVRDLAAIKVTGSDTALILCCESAEAKKEAILHLTRSPLAAVPVIIEHPTPCDYFTDTAARAALWERATKKGASLNPADRQQVLVQLVTQCAGVAGDVAEFGSFNGGSGAFIVEALKAAGASKQVWLFDSFGGIPAGTLGVDYRWHQSFSNNSFCEVRARFREDANVTVVRGPIQETIGRISGPLSFAHVDVDTLETGRLVTETIWPRLSAGGIVLYDDYGFYPNCMPLTAFVDEYFESRSCFRFHSPANGCFVMKLGEPLRGRGLV